MKKIKITFNEFNHYSNLIYSCMNAEEKDDQNSQSDLKYAFKKWQKEPLKLSEKETANAQEELADKIGAIEVKYGIKKENGALLKEENIVQFKAEDEIKAEKEKRAITKKINETAGSTVFEFEPFFYTNEERIATFDPFVREELTGIFFPEAKVKK